jgi:uncharacterized membrane protein
VWLLRGSSGAGAEKGRGSPEPSGSNSARAVVAYPDKETAERVLASLSELQRDGAIDLADAVVVTRSEDGRVELHESGGPEKAGAAADEALSHLALHGGHVLYTSLPQEDEARLRPALEA